MFDGYKYQRSVKVLAGRKVKLNNVHLYEGDDVQSDGRECGLFCVLSLKQVRKRCKGILQNLLFIRQQLHFARRLLRVYENSNQPKEVIDSQLLRRRILNSQYNSLYSRYKYSQRMEIILDANLEAVLTTSHGRCGA